MDIESINQRILLGIVLLDLRKERGITQDQIMEASGLNRPTIIDIEKGRKDYRISSLLRYLAVLESNLAIISPNEKQFRWEGSVWEIDF